MRVLGIGAHPDDLEISCGGTLAKLAAEGHTVHMAFLCSGNRGSMSDLPPERVVEVRRAEATSAARLIGAEVLPGGFVGDLDLYPEQERRDEVINLIRAAEPDMIITHGAVGDYNPDHIATNRLVLDAMQSASISRYETGQPPTPGRVPTYFFEPLGGLGFEPEEYVDISEAFDAKLRMWECHHSQIEFMEGARSTPVTRMIHITAEFRGVQCGVRYAEAFRPYQAYGVRSPSRMLP